MPNHLKQSVLFPELYSKPMVAEFTDERSSNDGGSILLLPIDRRMGLTESVAAQMLDRRQVAKVQHEYTCMFRHRVFGIANGYADTNDAASLAKDPILLLHCDQSPDGVALASQPTLSRFENAPSPRCLLRMAVEFARCVLREQQRQRRKRQPKLIRIDLDPTCDPTHGQQEFSQFNGFYGTSCYLPLVVTVSFDDEREKYVVGSVLRPGNASAMKGTCGVLLRLVRMLRGFFPMAKLRVRADGAYATPELLDCLEAAGMEYVIGMPGNVKLAKESEELMQQARVLQRASGNKETLYGECAYQAKSWLRSRRVVYKAEVVTYPERAPRDNDRYVVTNMKVKARGVFGEYHGHHDMENRIKELKCDLQMDRTSCGSFLANQLRLLLTVCAAALLQVLQAQLARLPVGELRHAQMGTIRERLFKRAVRVKESVRRVVLEYSVHYPWQDAWRRIALSLGAAAG